MKKIIDLHCDTLTASGEDGKRYELPMFNENCDLSFNKIPDGVKWAQLHAIFMPDQHRGDAAIDFYNQVKADYFTQLDIFSEKVSQCRSAENLERAWDEDKFPSMLTVEGGSVLAGDINRVKEIADDGVKVLTLVWNGENEIGSGHNTDHGLSVFGKAVIPVLEESGIIIDVSHLNDKGFRDFLEIADKPFMATHSNSRSVCSHKRNLTDDMIKEMVARDCLIGLNYYTAFLSDEAEKSCDYANMFYRHICHFIELGAEKNLALGSDFDGAYLPDCLNSPAKVLKMYDYLLKKGITSTQLENIFYKNALRFLRENMK